MGTQQITCDRCGRMDRWHGAEGWITFPDGWSLVYPFWRSLDSDPCALHLWLCDDCLLPSDDDGTSWVLPLGSDSDAPPIELLSEVE